MPYLTSFERLARKEMIQEILKTRFGSIDESLTVLVDRLSEMPTSDITSALLTLSKQELIERFS